MPASGRGANLDLTRRIVAAKPPPKPAPPPETHVNLHSTALPTQPFAPAQQQAQKAVVRAQAQQPAIAHPHIPRLPNPTPKQTTVALQLVAHSQRQALGPNPSAAKIRQYQTEVANDPHLRDFRETAAHYVRAAEGHQSAEEGRRVLSGAPTRSQTPYGALAGVSRAAEVAAGRTAQAAYAPLRSTAKPLPKKQDIALPLLGLANIRVPGTANLASGIGHTLAALTPGLQGATPETEFAKSIPSDIAAIGSFPVVAGYQGASAVAQSATQGSPKPLLQFGKGIAQGIEKGAPGSLVRGDWKQLEKDFHDHLLLSLAEIEGARTGAFRVAGAGARAIAKPGASGIRGAADVVGSRVRPPTALSQDAAVVRKGLVRQRNYSGDPLRKAVQAVFNGETMVDAHGKPVKTYDRGAQRPVKVAKQSIVPHMPGQAERGLQRRANFESSRKQGMERNARQRQEHASVTAQVGPDGKLQIVRNALPRAKRFVKGGQIGERVPKTHENMLDSLAVLVARGTINSTKHFNTELNDHIAMIRNAINTKDYPNDAELHAAKDNLALLEKASTSPRVMARKKEIVNAGLRGAAKLNEYDPKLVAANIRPAAEAHRGRLTEYAVARMGAKHVTESQHAALEQAARDAGLPRSEQIAVSGRHVEKTIAHESAKAAKGAAETAMRQVNARKAGLEKRLAAKKGAARRSQGGGANRVPMRRSDAKALRDLQGQLDRLNTASKSARKAHSQAEQAVRENPLPKRETALRDKAGKILTNKDIEDHARAHGRDPNTLAYLPHRLEAERGGSFHKQFDVNARPVTAGQRRTYHLYERGAASMSPHLFRDELTHKATTLVQAQQIDRTIGEAGILHPALEKARKGEPLDAREKAIVDNHGGSWNHPEAEKFAKDYNSGRPEGEQLILVRSHAAKLPKGMQEAIRAQQSTAGMEGAHLALLNERLAIGNDARARNVALMPKSQIMQLQRQLRPPGEIERFAQLMVGPFRMAVLPQPKWLTGNFVEPYLIRLPLNGSGAWLPGLGVDLLATRKLMKQLRGGPEKDKRLADELETQFGGLFVGNRGAVIHRTYQDFTGATRAVLHGGSFIRNLPVLKPIGDMILAIPKAFFHLNRVIEGTSQRAAFGNTLRKEMADASGNWMKAVVAAQPALDEAKRGLYNTAAQHRFMEAQYRMLGQYDGWSPAMRKLMQGWTPFLPWTLAAMRFVYWTVPVHHTATFTAMMQAAQRVMPEWEAEHANLPPGELRFSPKGPGGGWLNVLRDTPYSASVPISQGITTGDPGALAQFGAQVLPETSGLRETLGGRDPFGKAVKLAPTASNPTGKATLKDLLAIGGRQTAETAVPIVGLLSTILQGGATPYANSQPLLGDAKTKPGTKYGSGLARALSPVREIHVKAKEGPASPLPPAQQRATSRAEAQAEAILKRPGIKAQIEAAERVAERQH